LTSDPAQRQRQLRSALAPERWPLPLEALPPDTVLVGGAVRDGLLGRLPERPDLDLVVGEEAIGLARRLARRWGGSCVVLDQERSIARLVVAGWTIDLARRAGACLDDDLARRDFTVNAIALPLAGGELVDPQGGLADLAARRMVAIREANLLDDPLRLLRGIRLACELDFSIAANSWAWIRRHHARIGTVAGERVLAELERLATSASGQRGLAQVLQAGLLEPWHGDADGAATALLEPLTPARASEAGLTPEESAAALPLARLATVLDAEAIGRLHGSRRLQQRCQRLRSWRQRLSPGASLPLPSPDGLPEAARLSLQRQLETDLPALLLHLDPPVARIALERWRDTEDPLFHPRPPLDGRRLQQQLALPAGPLLGQLLDHLTGERAFGRLPRQADEGRTLTLARSWLAEQSHPRHG
jgi:tRNA nucleotidyltransferase (CCA-adding enzyme)